MYPQPKLKPGDFITIGLLNQIGAWLWNFEGEDGIAFRYEEGRVVASLLPGSAGGYMSTAAPWKLWGRLDGSTLQYAVCSGLWDGSSWSTAIAGPYLDPIGSLSNGAASAKAWTGATAGGVYAHFSCSAGAVTVTIDQTPGSDSSFYASPGILNVKIGSIAADGSVTQEMAMGTFTMSQVPAFYSGYAAGSIQSFQHLANAAPSWDTDGDCDA